MPVTSPTYRLSDDQFARIEHLLPENGQRGGQWKDHRLMIDGILWALADGGRWRNLPAEFGPWQSVYDRFRNWTRRGLWDRILRHLQARMMRDGEIDWWARTTVPSMQNSPQSISPSRIMRAWRWRRIRSHRPRRVQLRKRS